MAVKMRLDSGFADLHLVGPHAPCEFPAEAAAPR